MICDSRHRNQGTPKHLAQYKPDCFASFEFQISSNAGNFLRCLRSPWLHERYGFLAILITAPDLKANRRSSLTGFFDPDFSTAGSRITQVWLKSSRLSFPRFKLSQFPVTPEEVSTCFVSLVSPPAFW